MNYGFQVNIIYDNTDEHDKILKKKKELMLDYPENIIIDNTFFRDISTREKLKKNLEIKHCLGQSLFHKEIITKDKCILLIKLIDNILDTNKKFNIYNIHSNNNIIYYLGLYTSHIKNLKYFVDNNIYDFAGYKFFIKVLNSYINIYSYKSQTLLYTSSQKNYIFNGIKECKYPENIQKCLIKNDKFMELYSKEDKYEFMKEVGELLIAFLEEFKYNLEGEKCLLSDSTTKSASKI